MDQQHKNISLCLNSPFSNRCYLMHILTKMLIFFYYMIFIIVHDGGKEAQLCKSRTRLSYYSWL